ncbi:MAG: hypothetical protein ACXWKM_02845 [Phenylobacterium sp.]
MKRLAVLPMVLLLAACQRGPSTEAQLLARQQAVDPPRLWLMEDADAAGAVRAAAWVCADTPMMKTFAKTNAEIGGAPCNDTVAPVARPGFSAHRCEVDGRRYAITSQAVGDLDRDFRLTVMVTPLSADLGPARTTRHYRRLGACPAGWQVGDLQPRR